MDIPRIQIYMPEDYFEGRKPTMPKAAWSGKSSIFIPQKKA